MRSCWGVSGFNVAATAIACALLSPGTASAQRVSSGWAWQNPAPLGRVARGVVRATPYEYAIGDDGTLLRGSDAGADWSALDTGIDEPVSRLEVIDAATLVIGDPQGCATRISTDAGQTFTPIFASPSRCMPVAAFSFVSPSVGFVLRRNGAVDRTTDGGRSFTAAASIPGTPASIGIDNEKRFAAFEGLGVELHFSTPSSGIAFVTPRSGPSAAFATTDGGASWSAIALPAMSQVEHVDFVNGQTAYAAGPSGLLYSGDAGASWTALGLPPLARRPEAVFCVAAIGCLAKLWLTTDMVALHGAAAPSSYVAPALPLCSVGEQLPSQIVTVPQETNPENASLVSGEAGQACSSQSAREEVEYGRLLQGPGQLVYAPGTRGRLALSSDEGRSWKIVATPSSTLLTDASFSDARHGLTLDRHGAVRQTDDGGASWRTLHPGTKGAPRAVAMLAPRTLLALGATGIRRFHDAGRFAAIGGHGANAAHLVDFDVVGSTVFAYGLHVLLRSTDGGARWTALRLPRRGGEGTIGIRDVSFISAARGYASDDWETLWSTRDGGRHWRQVLSTGAGEAEHVHFVDAQDGYLTDLTYPADEHHTYVLHTSDGGATWSPEYVGPGWSASAVVGRGADAAVLLQEPTSGDMGTMLYTASSFGESGGHHARVELHASRRAITGHELLAGHGAAVVTVEGTLSTGAAGERVILAHRSLRGTIWDNRLVTTGPGGRFVTRWSVGSSSVFVAQWVGDPGQTGAGSRPLTITTPSR
jgi:photosystem II stability/assembly factor-like uncharacterized protein